MSKRRILVTLCLAFVLSLSLVIGTHSITAKAEVGTFQMVDGASIRLTPATVGQEEITDGIRFKVEMDENTVNYIKSSEEVNLYFLVSPEELFEANKTVKDNWFLADKGNIFEEDGKYYACGVLCNILEANRARKFKAVAIIENADKTFTYAQESTTTRSLYDVVNSAVLDPESEYTAQIMGATVGTSYASWFATKDYPVQVQTVEQYNKLAKDINSSLFSSAISVNAVEGVEPTTPITNQDVTISKTHKVTFTVGDEETSQFVEDGQSATAPTATKAEDEDFVYAFASWVDENGEVVDISAITSDIQVSASFSKAVKSTSTKKFVLLDAKTEYTMFSNTYVDETADNIGQMGWGKENYTTFTSATDSEYGDIITTSNISGYILTWTNFNSGVNGSIKDYWSNKLAGLDKILLYVKNHETSNRLHQLRFAAPNDGVSVGPFVLNPGWNKIVIEKSVFMNLLDYCEANGFNPYLKIHLKNSDGSDNGSGQDKAFSFSSFYGYTNAGYAAAFPEVKVVLDAKTQISMYSDNLYSENDTEFATGHWYRSQSFVSETDSVYGDVVSTKNMECNTVARFNFNNGVDYTKYWRENLKGFDKIVFYMYYAGLNETINFKITSANVAHYTNDVTLNQGWNKIVINVSDFLAITDYTVKSPYMHFSGTQTPGTSPAPVIKITSIYACTEAGYEKNFSNKKVVLDAKTEYAKFSNTYVDETTDGVYELLMKNGENKGTTYTASTDATYGDIITTSNVAGSGYAWANFNTGVDGSLKDYWSKKLAGFDKVVFYVRNNEPSNKTGRKHELWLGSADNGYGIGNITLTVDEWNKVVVSTSDFISLLSYCESKDVNPYIFYKLVDSNGNISYSASGKSFSFTSFYAYTNEAYAEEFGE